MSHINSPKIVLVDDDSFCLSIYEQEIINLGFTQVKTYTSGAELLENMQDPPDIIFLDYNLQDMKGLDVLKKIKKNNRKTDVVIVSSQTDMHVTVELLKNGASDYIVKDEFDTLKIAVVIAKWMSVKELKAKKGYNMISDQSEKYVNVIMQAQKNVRREITDELHDNVSQLLGAAKLYIETAVKNETNRLPMLKESSEILNEAINELRNLCHNLYSINVRSHNLGVQLERIINDLKVQDRFIVQTEFSGALTNEHIPESVQHELVRIIQEISNNMVKYASAKNVDISITSDKRNLHLQFADDGIGFDMEGTKRGLGLNNIIRRVTDVNGKYVLYSAPGQGCRWKIQIPIQQYEQKIRV